VVTEADLSLVLVREACVFDRRVWRCDLRWFLTVACVPEAAPAVAFTDVWPADAPAEAPEPLAEAEAEAPDDPPVEAETLAPLVDAEADALVEPVLTPVFTEPLEVETVAPVDFPPVDALTPVDPPPDVTPALVEPLETPALVDPPPVETDTPVPPEPDPVETDTPVPLEPDDGVRAPDVPAETLVPLPVDTLTPIPAAIAVVVAHATTMEATSDAAKTFARMMTGTPAPTNACLRRLVLDLVKTSYSKMHAASFSARILSAVRGRTSRGCALPSLPRWPAIGRGCPVVLHDVPLGHHGSG
jgi:hypothetical protein